MIRIRHEASTEGAMWLFAAGWATKQSSPQRNGAQGRPVMELGPKPLSPLERLVKSIGYRVGLNITYDGVTRAVKFKPGKGHKYIAARLRESAHWTLPARDACDAHYRGGELYEIWRAIPGGDKWLHYFPIYEQLLSRYREKEVRVLEIGVFRGASMKMLRQYLGQNATIVGADVRPEWKDTEDPVNALFVEIGSEGDAEFLRSLVAKFGPFDVIIDDASHIATHQFSGFNALFRDGLQDDGIYIVEDTHCSYWESHRDRGASMMDFAYSVVDLMHRHHFEFQRRFPYTPGDTERQIQTNYLAQHLDHVSFYDSIIVFQKAMRQLPPICVNK